MRILHTSDWHLGQHFMGKSRQAEHQALIDWLLVQVGEYQVDAVLIAGDIFDTGTPPSYARELYSQLVVRLHSAAVPLLLLGGNHDSVATLRESSALLACLTTTVVPAVEDPRKHVRVLAPRGGSVESDVGCVVCAVPFIRARDVVLSEAGQSAEDKRRVLQAAIQNYYGRVFDAASEVRAELTAKLGHPIPLVATGHLTTVGATVSESVREIYVGTLESFPTDAFPPVDYVALGHIHRPQKVGGCNHIRYSGSPIPLSFDEALQQKEVLLVDLVDGGLKAVTPLLVPRFQPLVSVSGNLATLASAIQTAALEGSAERPAWLEVTVTGDDYLADLPARVQTIADGLPVDILRIRRERKNASAFFVANNRETLDDLGPQVVFSRRLEQEQLNDDLKAALTERYREVIDTLREGEV